MICRSKVFEEYAAVMMNTGFGSPSAFTACITPSASTPAIKRSITTTSGFSSRILVSSAVPFLFTVTTCAPREANASVLSRLHSPSSAQMMTFICFSMAYLLRDLNCEQILPYYTRYFKRVNEISLINLFPNKNMHLDFVSFHHAFGWYTSYFDKNQQIIKHFYYSQYPGEFLTKKMYETERKPIL